MGKITKLVVIGASGTGKTSILERLIYGENHCNTQYSTIEDIYLAQIDTDRGVKEAVRIQDTPGRNLKELASFPKQYFHYGDGFILVYDITDQESFKFVEIMKKEIDKARERKEITIYVIGNKSDLDDKRKVDTSQIQNWAAKEKVRLFETNIFNRKLLSEPFISICSKMTQPPVKSTPFGSRRTKQQTID